MTGNCANLQFLTDGLLSNQKSGQVTYVEPCSAAYAVFGELQVLSIEITVELPSGQSTVGLSEIYILGK